MFQNVIAQFPEVSMRTLALILATSAGWLCAQDVQYPTMIQWNGTQGLTQTRSAEGMGEGFLSLSATGTGYAVDKGVSGRTAQSGTDVFTGTYALGLGLSDWADLSGWFSHYGTSNSDGNVPSPTSGMGASGIQLQLCAPWDSTFPLRLAIQGGLVAGTSENQVQLGYTSAGTPRADGWDYFETRSGYDLQVRLLQTLRSGNASFPVRFHLNEGLVRAIDANDHSMLMVLDGGLELDPLPALTVALEGHTRTGMSNFDPQLDPTWGTASFTFHLPGNVQFQVGGDLAFSQDRNVTDTRALDPWRAFANLSVGVDLAADAKKARAEARRNDSLERVAFKAKIAEGEIGRAHV